MFDPKGGQNGFPGFGGDRSDGGDKDELPPDILYGLGGDHGPILPEEPGSELDQENAGSDDLLDIGLHFYEKMNEL
jgi:hypothetical protein